MITAIPFDATDPQIFHTEIGPNVIAMLLLVSSQSGVRSMNLVLDGARERSIAPGTSIIDCPEAQWIWRFYDGHVVILRGAFSCQISAFHNSQATSDQLPYTLKFESMSFDSNSHDRLITLESIKGTRGVENLQKTPSTTTQGSPEGTLSSSGGSASTGKVEDAVDRLFDDPRVMIDHALLPPEPINSFGIPQASMRCLEVGRKHRCYPEVFLISLSFLLASRKCWTDDRAVPIRLRAPARASRFVRFRFSTIEL